MLETTPGPGSSTPEHATFERAGFDREDMDDISATQLNGHVGNRLQRKDFQSKTVSFRRKASRS